MFAENFPIIKKFYNNAALKKFNAQNTHSHTHTHKDTTNGNAKP